MQIEPYFIDSIRQLLQQARSQVIKQVNSLMVSTYFEIGKRIVEQEQAGKEYATYGTFLIETLAKNLTEEFGKGFSTTNLKQMRSFYMTYSNRQTLSDDLAIFQNKLFVLSWSHYLKLMRITNEDERSFYEIESQTNCKGNKNETITHVFKIFGVCQAACLLQFKYGSSQSSKNILGVI